LSPSCSAAERWLLDYRLGDMVKLDILVNGEKVAALSQLVHREFSRPRALRYCERLAKTIPRLLLPGPQLLPLM
jgi:translation elongation factor EF-4